MLTPEDIDNVIETIHYHLVPGSTTTICALTLRDSGFVAVGTSACIDPADFDADIGEAEALKDAKRKVWEVEGYRIRYLEALSKDPELQRIQSQIDRLDQQGTPRIALPFGGR